LLEKDRPESSRSGGVRKEHCVNLHNLAKLKEQLVRATDSFPVMDYFMTQFGEDPRFLQIGRPVEDPMIEGAIQAAGKQIFPEATSIRLTHVRFIEVPGHQFIHGGFFLNGCVSTLFYFTDLHQGMMAVAVSMRGDTRLVRFSGMQPDPSREPSAN
jgi:hypothetical protein